MLTVERFFRLLAGVALGSGLLIWAQTSYPDPVGPLDKVYVVWIVAVAGFITGWILAPYFTTKPYHWVVTKVHTLSPADLVGAGVGFLVGLLCSALIAIPLSMLPSSFGQILPIVVCVFFARLGISLGIQRKRELVGVIGSRWAGLEDVASGSQQKVLLDTSAIIDGRIADISQTGFIPGAMVIPRFVLDELQHIADSSDALRRNRGRRGLDMLARLQKESVVSVEIMDTADKENGEVDARLVRLARDLNAQIVTNDFNLNRVAGLQGVKVLNINALANAVKPVLLPGEEMTVKVIQEGKEQNQGVGYLDDGTMVVVENGRRFVNSEVNIVVSRVLQTVAGRMIFAHVRGE